MPAKEDLQFSFSLSYFLFSEKKVGGLGASRNPPQSSLNAGFTP
jgi:hypothetical protein